MKENNMCLFAKWELIEEKSERRQSNWLGFHQLDDIITYVDVYRKKKLNGIYKYKTVEILSG